MSAAEFAQLLTVGLIALAGASLLILALAGGVHFEPHIRKTGSVLLPALLLFGLAASTMLSGRNTSLYGLSANIVQATSSGAEVWVLRLVTATAMGIAIVIVGAAYLRKTKSNSSAKLLFIAFFTYFLASYVASGIFGTDFSLSHKTFYPLLVIYALYITADQEARQLVRLSRNLLLLVLIVGLCLITVEPDLVLQKSYQGFIPGLSFRYWGLASHANNIGPLSIFLVLLLCWTPYKSRLLTLLAISVAGISLGLAQSKTSLVAAVLVVTVFILRWWHLAVFKDRFGRAGSVAALCAGIVVAVSAFALAIYFANHYLHPIDSLVYKLQGRGTILTGREQIWAITVAEWQRSPIFGYGPNLWGNEFSARFGYSGIATNAHNQLFDTLGSAGVLGVVSLLVYATVFVRYAFLLAESTKWVSIALAVFLAARCVTEVPLKTINITTSDFFMHAVIVGIFMRAAVRLSKEKSQDIQSSNAGA